MNLDPPAAVDAGKDDLVGPGRENGHNIHLNANGLPRTIETRFVVEPEFAGLRLDLYLKKKLRRLSRTRLQEIIRTQLSQHEDRTLKAHSVVKSGDTLVIRRPARPEPPCPRDFGVLAQDDHFLVVDKPAGLPMHASARFFFNTLTRVIFERFPGEALQICHRLDRETSGCVVLARGKEAASRLKQAFAKRTIKKKYLAMVHGHPHWAGEHVIDVPLILAGEHSEHISIKMIPALEPGAGLPSTTKVRVLERYGRGAKAYALVECRPVTGRQHQIRAHLAHAAFPIVGDKLYTHGDQAFTSFCDRETAGIPRAELEAEFGMKRQALHAAEITFPHPITGDPITVASPVPNDFSEFLKRMLGVAI